VELEGDGEKHYGWIASWVVKEINEQECYRLEKSPGSH
jgi:hypothetical protein